ncbi:MAG: ferric-dicitrate binding protein FerR (iron transport regulator) [Saprospiraceae bacterium]
MLGTAFNVRDLATETMNSVSIKEGKVSVEATKNQQKVILTANEKAIYNAVTNELIEEKDLNLNDLAWQRKKLKFQEMAFADVAGAIAQQYQISVTIRNQKMMQCLVNGQYNLTTNVENLLKNISSIYRAEVTKLGENNFEITGGSCQ